MSSRPSTRSHETVNTSPPSHLLRRHRWSIANPSTRTSIATAPSPAPRITFPTKLRISCSRPGSTLSGTSANRTNTRDIVLPRSPQFVPRRRERGQSGVGQTCAKAHGGSGVESGSAGGSSSSGLVLDEAGDAARGTSREELERGCDGDWMVDPKEVVRDKRREHGCWRVRNGEDAGEYMVWMSEGGRRRSDGSEDGIIRGGRDSDDKWKRGYSK
ncbi:hypothetical protein EDB83DRAFT_2344293 [Lactarius deliciosus]|nr:hypothetical protein EDB83DRAFT_2344293 [Lactarius deliciosus]